MPLSPYRFFFLPYRFAGYLHLSQSKRFMHMRPPSQKIIRSASIDLGHSYLCCKNASWSKLTVATCSHNVINGPWCLKMAFGLILLSFLLSFCYRFVSRKFSPFVGHTYTWSSQNASLHCRTVTLTSPQTHNAMQNMWLTWMNPIPPEEAHSARIMMVTYVDTYIHIHTYVYIYIYMYTHMHVYIYICIYNT